MLPRHYKRKLQYLQTVQIYHKELPRLSGIIRVHSGRTERTSPITSERFSPQKPMQAHFPAGAAAAAAHSRPIKKLSPVSMRGNSQNGGQTTKSLLTKPQCSGVPIQQAVSLSSSFPRHCLLFVCAFFREIQAVSRSECCPAARSPAYKNRPGFPLWKSGRFVCFICAFSSAHAKPLAGVLDRSLSSGQGVHSNDVFFFYHDVFF